MPHCFAGADAARERMTGGGGADHPQRGIQPAIRGAQGVAVHGGDVGRRLCQARGNRGGGDPVPGLGEGDDLGRRGVQVGQDAVAGFLDADHGRLTS